MRLSKRRAKKKGVPRMKAKVNYHWFKSVLSDRQLSQRQLAAMLHLDPSAVNYMLRGRRGMRLAEANELAKILEVPLEEVLQNAGINVPEGALSGEDKVAVAGWVDADFAVHREKIKGMKAVEAPPFGGTGLEALVCQIEEGGPFDGAVIYYRSKLGKGVPAEAVGRLCVVTTIEGTQMVRVIRHGMKRGFYGLRRLSDGPVESDVWLDSAAVVVWVKMAG
jgi:transcriptional regulator with XRE-family HTH domain